MTAVIDAIVVGAGFSGSVLAERLASQLGYRVLVLEKQDHVAGHCYDTEDEYGRPRPDARPPPLSYIK